MTNNPSRSNLQWWIPLVRISPLNTFVSRLAWKCSWIISTLVGRVYAILKIRGALIVGKDLNENTILKLNKDCPLGERGDSLVMAKDLVIFEGVRATGQWEFEIASFLAQDFLRGKGDNRTIFLDIGANSGLITKQVARLSSSPINSICVEPLPRNFQALKQNLSELSNCELFEFGLGDESIETTAYSEKANIGNTTLRKTHSSMLDRTIVKVRSTKEFIETKIPKHVPVVLKCDTQGFESIILAEFPEEFWNRITSGVIEITSVPDLSSFKLEVICFHLSKFMQLGWDTDLFGSTLKVDEVMNFWNNGKNEERNLFFRR